MASRRRRGGVPAREDEPRRQERAKQHASRCRVLYFPHRRLWIMEYSCKVWCKPCRRRLILRQHSRHSWRLRLYQAKFVPEHIHDRMEQEFLSLAQGSMTVLEYEARFSELSKYAPHIVAYERKKTKKFVMGLKPSLRTRLVAFDHRTLEEALSVAYRQEGEMEQYLEEKKASQKRPVATVSPLREDTWRYRMLDDYGKVLEVRKQRPQDQELSETSVGSPARSASPSSSASYRKTRKASSPSSSVCFSARGRRAGGACHRRQLALEFGIESEDLEVPLSVHTPVGVVGDTALEETVESDSERGE
ncbi:hypothetical protein Taro_015170 [Colocasia esculenta]|uniref:Retrotransposon gag domain-containing protein n=1 Tax=Colocasia esculenta TaxID=4460 RepID=A0A843ULL2_COLES|nr:hypothetical protein [Colocasia esculenta]